MTLAPGFRPEIEFNLSLLCEPFASGLRTDQGVFWLLSMTYDLGRGTPLGTGRLIVCCVLIQKLWQIYQGEISMD
jgi:hypothetical protein